MLTSYKSIFFRVIQQNSVDNVLVCRYHRLIALLLLNEIGILKGE